MPRLALAAALCALASCDLALDFGSLNWPDSGNAGGGDAGESGRPDAAPAGLDAGQPPDASAGGADIGLADAGLEDVGASRDASRPDGSLADGGGLPDTGSADVGWPDSGPEPDGGRGYSTWVSIANSNVVDLVDHQVAIVVDTASLVKAGKMRSDCADLRVVDPAGDTLPFWIDNTPGCNNAQTVVWTKVPVPIVGVTVYLDYGDGRATSLSSGEATFVFFDDFESGDLSRWETVAGATNVQLADGNRVAQITAGASSGWLYNGKSGSDCAKWTDYLVHARLRQDAVNLLGNIRFVTRVRQPFAPDQWYQFGVSDKSDGSHETVLAIQLPTWTGPETAPPVISLGRWYASDFGLAGVNLNAWFDVASPWFNPPALSTTDSHYSNGCFGFATWDGGSIYVDDVFVRRYIPDEPIATIGAESPR